MNYRNLRRPVALGLAMLLTAAMLFGCTPTVEYTPMTTVPTEPTTEPTTEPPTEPTTEPTTEPPTEPQAVTYTLSFAGDCTLGSEHSSYNSSGSFVKVVGNNYNYPFQNALPYFEADDFTMVNFEGVLCTNRTPATKTFRFRGPVEYAKMLTAGSIEAVNLANNHTKDYGTSGYNSTLDALKTEKVTYVENTGTATFTTASGLKIGMYAGQFAVDQADMKKDIKKLRDDGAEIIIASFHWGVEGGYRPTADQKNLAHAAIDAGADIVFGHHPHVLQPVEKYQKGIIYYSLGNFAFGGNKNPTDKDTAVIQQLIIREPDGTICLGETKLIPFRISSVTKSNDYKPTPYAVDSTDYKRAMTKLDGTFNGPDLVMNNPTTAPTTRPTTPTTQPTTQPTEPSTQPTKPSIRPIEPTTEPTNPTTQPTEPSTQPTQPSGGGAEGEFDFT